jgi:uncharacterized delta-60 repeat protein
MRKSLFDWENPLTRLGLGRSKKGKRCRQLKTRSMRFEPLEEGQLLSVVPAIGAVSLSRNSVNLGDSVTLTANNVAEPGVNVESVSFYRLASNGVSLIGTDADGSDGWAIDYTADSQLAGMCRFLAVATDGTNHSQPVVPTVSQIIPLETDSISPSPILSTDNRASNIALDPYLDMGMSLMSVGGSGVEVSISGAASVDEGSAFALSPLASGEGAGGITDWQIDWGDGQIDTNPPSFTHYYADGPADYKIAAAAAAGANTFGSDGKLDTSFFDGGVYSIAGAMNDSADMVLLPDGNAALLGVYGELYSTGSLNIDLSTYFPFANYLGNNHMAAQPQPDGSVELLISGPPSNDDNISVVKVMRFLDDGTLDPSFGPNGMVATAFEMWPYGMCTYNSTSLAVLPDGSFVVSGCLTGTDISVQHFYANGTLDTSFGGNGDGIATMDFGDCNLGNKILVLPNGEILAGGDFGWFNGYSYYWKLVKLDESGAFDSTFGESGVLTLGQYINAIAGQSDGSIIVADGYGVTRYDFDGTQDTSFNNGQGTIAFAGSAISIQRDDKILVLGTLGDINCSWFSLNRYNANGTRDVFFGSNGSVQQDHGYNDSHAVPVGLGVQSDGKIVIAGNFDDLLFARFDSGLQVHVDNATPTLTVPGNIILKEGMPLDLTNLVSFVDPGFDDPSENAASADWFTYSIDWGDTQSDSDLYACDVTQGGPGLSTTGRIDAFHYYENVGDYTITVTIADDDGGWDSKTFNLSVVRPSMTISGDSRVGVDSAYTLNLGAVTIPGENTIERYTVNWGDGRSDVYSAAEIAANPYVTHFYDQGPGFFDVSVDLSDEDGAYFDVAQFPGLEVTPFLPDLSAVTFSAHMAGSCRVANVGDSFAHGGHFTLTPPPDLTGGSISLDSSSGAVDWEPSTIDCPQANYTFDVSYTYNGHTWSKTFALEIDTCDTPPRFPDRDFKHESIPVEDDPAAQYYEHYFTAYDKEDETLTYTLLGNKPADAAIAPDGLFTCYFSNADEFKVYDFDVKATDSSGQYDMMHVVLGIQVIGKGYPISASNSCASVAMNSEDDRIDLSYGPGHGFQIPELGMNAAFILDTGPNQGSLDSTHAVSDGYVVYTPDQDFRGLDIFTCHWEYDRLEYGTGRPLGRVSTNTVRQEIQVGPWVCLQPAAMPVVDGIYIMGVGQRKIVTLTLQNPRGDGVPVTGYWNLSFSPYAMRIYKEGEKVLPGQSFLEENVCGEKTILLEVEGLDGQPAAITAEWRIWTGVYGASSNNCASLWNSYTTYRVEIYVVRADVDVDSNNDGQLDPDNSPFGTDDPIEQRSPGQVFAVNDDDDNENGIADKDDSGPVAGEDDLLLVVLNISPILTPAAPGEVIAKLTVDGDVRVWADPARNALLADSYGSKTWDLFSEVVPQWVWVEGVSPGTADLDFTVQVKGTDVARDKAKATAVQLQSLKVTDLNDKTNYVTATDATPKTIEMEEDSKGYFNIDVKIDFTPPLVGIYIHWRVEQGGATIKEGTANKSVPPLKLEASKGAVTITAWLNIGGSRQARQINVVPPNINPSRVDTSMSNTWDAFKDTVHNTTPENMLYYYGHCGPDDVSSPYTQLEFRKSFLLLKVISQCYVTRC